MSEHKAEASDRLARHYALAMLEMQGDIKRQRQFIEINVPEDLRDLVKTSYLTLLVCG